MTYEEAANRIEEHAAIHYSKEDPHAEKITEALTMAVSLLRKMAAIENAIENFAAKNN